MTSTIRISAPGKRALEAVRRRMEIAEGRALTQEDAAGRAFVFLASHPELIPEKPWKMTPAQRAFMAAWIGSGSDDMGPSGLNDESDGPKDAAHVDDVLYGRRE